MKGFYFSSTLMWDADAETLMRTAAKMARLDRISDI